MSPEIFSGIPYDGRHLHIQQYLPEEHVPEQDFHYVNHVGLVLIGSSPISKGPAEARSLAIRKSGEADLVLITDKPRVTKGIKFETVARNSYHIFAVRLEDQETRDALNQARHRGFLESCKS